MRLIDPPRPALSAIRRPAVAGTFYPADPGALVDLVDGLIARVVPVPGDDAATSTLAGILVPHAGLAYSGAVAAVAWQRLARSLAAPDGTRSGPMPTLVLLGTVHRAWWLHGVGVWEAGSWRTPIGDIEVDASLASEIAALGPSFTIDREAHVEEHSLEVQLPFIARVLAGARIVPLAVAAGTGDLAIAVGERIGAILARQRARGLPTVLVVSTDMAHYPPAHVAERITDALAADILALDPVGLAAHEAEVSGSGVPGVVCGMCGIAPAVAAVAALRRMGVQHGVRLAEATSAEHGGPRDHTVGYLSVAFVDAHPWDQPNGSA